MITRENYEEFFLLYIDNELSVQERQIVERFVAENADLQEELNSLLQCRINPEDHFVFINKDSLLRQDDFLKQEKLQADQAFSLNDVSQLLFLNERNQPFSLNDGNYEAYFISYIDGELDEEGRRAVEDYAVANPSRLLELQLLQRTILVPDESVVFEKKENLYRKEGKGRILPMPWLRAAAAAVVLLGTGLYIFNTRKSDSITTRIASSIPGGNKTAVKPLNGQTANPGEGQDTKNLVTNVTHTATDTLNHQEPHHEGQDLEGQHHEGQMTRLPADMNKPNLQGTDLTVNSSSKLLAGRKNNAGTNGLPDRVNDGTTARTNGGTTVRADGRNNQSDGKDLAYAGSVLKNTQPAKWSVKQDIPDEQNNHLLNQIAARDPKGPEGNHVPAQINQQTADGQGSISRENSSFATQALLSGENSSQDDSYASEEPASPKKTKLRGLFRRVSRVFEKTTNVDDDKHGVLIGSFQFALK